MKIIIFATLASLVLVSPAMGKTTEKSVSFESVIDKVNALTAVNNAIVVANTARVEMAKGTNKKVTPIKF